MIAIGRPAGQIKTTASVSAAGASGAPSLSEEAARTRGPFATGRGLARPKCPSDDRLRIRRSAPRAGGPRNKSIREPGARLCGSRARATGAPPKTRICT